MDLETFLMFLEENFRDYETFSGKLYPLACEFSGEIRSSWAHNMALVGKPLCLSDVYASLKQALLSKAKAKAQKAKIKDYKGTRYQELEVLEEYFYQMYLENIKEIKEILECMK